MKKSTGNIAVYTEPITKLNNHGMVGTPEYWAWRDIKKRCYNPNNKWYKNYGGRGIRMQESWIKDFMQFFNDVGKKPNRSYSIDRINNDGDYTKENTKWSSKIEQDNNRRTNKYITYNGKTKTIADWSRHTGIQYTTLYYRLFRFNWSVDKAFNTPVRHN